MAMGKPVIAYISDDLYEKYKPPIYRTTKGTFKHDLESLLEDIAERDRLSREGQTYVRRLHSIQSTINTVYECYNKLMR
jgi:glycosyltransferase involved in cell wall biosynthesis